MLTEFFLPKFNLREDKHKGMWFDLQFSFSKSDIVLDSYFYSHNILD